jgi:adenylate kinase
LSFIHGITPLSSPDVMIVLRVPEQELIARVVGRRMDPVSGKIYHTRYNPPPANVAARCVVRVDDTAEKAHTRWVV